MPMYAGCDVDEVVKLFRVRDGKSELVHREEWCEVLDELDAKPGEMLLVALRREQSSDELKDEDWDEEDFDDIEEETIVPPNEDGSIRVDQLKLVCKLMQYMADSHGGKISLSQRQSNALIAAANLIVEEFGKPVVNATAGMGLDKWLASDDTGLSSREIARTLGPLAGFRTRIPDESHWHRGEACAPSDPSDLGRCLRLLEAVPELVPFMDAMKERSPLWKAYIARWPEMVALYKEELPTGSAPKLYDLMQSIQNEVRKEKT